MPDITIGFTDAFLHGDFIVGDVDLVTGDDLKTSILVSLFTDRGWWADLYEPDVWGCRLSELFRAKHSNDTLLRARDYCRQSLAWLIDDQVARAVDVTTAWIGTTLAIGIVVTQATGTTRYSFEWRGI
jgi:phage gp46-like protein